MVGGVRRLLIGATVLLAVGWLVLASPGCQDPTQVTLDISLDRKASCDEIRTGGTAITVGVEPRATEEQVNQGFVSAKTNECTSATNQIGTLVVTPTDPEKAAVIVVVGYKGKDPTTCRAPLYEGCIVSRRRFVFATHVRLHMPIVIDPDCANVPCDAFTTCNKGSCVDAEALCSGSECETPGDLPDGGLDESSVVADVNPLIPDGGPGPGPGSEVDGGDSGSATDAESDGGGVPDPNGVSCNANQQIVCGGQTCGATQACCQPTNPKMCSPICTLPTDGFCCVNSQCPQPNHFCGGRNGSTPGKCQLTVSMPQDGGYPICNPTLNCAPNNACNGLNDACCQAGGMPVCNPGAGTCAGATRYCCRPADCDVLPDGGRTTCSPTGPGYGTCLSL